MMVKQLPECYPENEARRRFEAALRGSRKVGHVPIEKHDSKAARGATKKEAR